MDMADQVLVLVGTQRETPVVTYTDNATVINAANAGNYAVAPSVNVTVTYSRYVSGYRLKNIAVATPTVATTSPAVTFVMGTGGSAVTTTWETTYVLVVTGKAVQNPTIKYADVADIAAYGASCQLINTTTNSSNYQVVGGSKNITGTVNPYCTTDGISYRIYTVTCTTGTNPAAHVPTMTFSIGTATRTMVFTFKYLSKCPVCGEGGKVENSTTIGRGKIIASGDGSKVECTECGYDGSFDVGFTET